MLDVKNISAVIFDMDGVVLDSERNWQAADLAADKKFDTGFDESVRFMFCGMGEAAVRELLHELKPDLDVAAYRDYIRQCVHDAEEKSGAPVKQGFTEFFALLRSLKIKTALATSSHRARVRPLLARSGIDIASFDAAVCGDEVTRCKPDPEIFLKAAELLAVPPCNAAVIEDSPNGLKAAFAGGFVPIMVVDLIPPPAELIAKGLNVYYSLTDLAALF